MKRIRLFIWWILAASAIGGAFVLSYVPAELDVLEAREDYAEARRQIENVNIHRTRLQERLDALRTDVESVELDARAEYRLIKPGERLEIIEMRPPEDSFFARSQ